MTGRRKAGTRLSRAKKSAAKQSKAGIHERIRVVILTVPRGKVATYGAVARAAGHARASRLVARILNNSEGLPWQRILGAGGAIKLPGEAGMEQRFRLQMEGVTFRGRRVDMKRHEHKFTESAGKKTSAEARAFQEPAEPLVPTRKLPSQSRTKP